MNQCNLAALLLQVAAFMKRTFPDGLATNRFPFKLD